MSNAAMPWGTLPVLKIDGKMVSGSKVVAKFIAARHGKYAMDWSSKETMMSTICYNVYHSRTSIVYYFTYFWSFITQV